MKAFMKLWRKRTVRPGGKPKHRPYMFLIGLFVVLAGVSTVGVGAASADPIVLNYCPAGTVVAAATIDVPGQGTYDIVSTTGLSAFSVQYDANNGFPIVTVTATSASGYEITGYRYKANGTQTIGDYGLPTTSLEGLVVLGSQGQTLPRQVEICSTATNT